MPCLKTTVPGNLLLLLLLLLQVIPVKVNYNYFTLYKASSLNLKIIWSKRVSFFVFLRCCIFIRRRHGSRLSAIVRSDSICFYWNGWMKIDHSFWYTMYKSCQRESKINYYSWFLCCDRSRLTDCLWSVF